MVSASLALLVWLLALTVATLVRVPVGLPLSCALTVNTTVLFAGIAGIVTPDALCMLATVKAVPAVGQVAPPDAVHVTLLTLRLLTAGSLNTAALALAVDKVIPVALLMVIV